MGLLPITLKSTLPIWQNTKRDAREPAMSSLVVFFLVSLIYLSYADARITKDYCPYIAFWYSGEYHQDLTGLCGIFWERVVSEKTHWICYQVTKTRRHGAMTRRHGAIVSCLETVVLNQSKCTLCRTLGHTRWYKVSPVEFVSMFYFGGILNYLCNYFDI